MPRNPKNPPYISSLHKESINRYRTTIPKPVGELMEKKANSTWKVVFKLENGKIKLYWEPFPSQS